ncbi:YIP1 family protein [Candidatus Woesearchaeota archaeon]|nr:YIP1 family protein [Candidatus Woesearchaeota archaeon]
MGLFNTWKEIMFNPINFYGKLSKKDQYAEATKYFLKVQAIVSALLLITMGLIVSAAIAFGGMADKVIWVVLGLIVAYPFMLLFAWGMLYVGAGILHLFVLIFSGKKGYVETFKVVAYSISPQIFGVIPIINYLAMAYILILQVIGIKKRQQLSWGKSAAVVLIPAGIGIVLGIIIYFTLMASLLPLMALGGALT